MVSPDPQSFVAKAPLPFWSVMIPAYNSVREYLVEALESVLSQDAGPDKMQIEVVDDCSADLEYDLDALVQEIGK
jgi:glycosyltransferase involved in cell wall biosynthesis